MTDWRKKSEPVEGGETYVVCRDGKPYIATHDARLVLDGVVRYEMKKGQPVTGTHNQCSKALMELQGQSTDWAMRHEGWAILPYEEKNAPAGD